MDIKTYVSPKGGTTITLIITGVGVVTVLINWVTIGVGNMSQWLAWLVANGFVGK